jgi:pyrroloquinoline quinone biosynthesis protein B
MHTARSRVALLVALTAFGCATAREEPRLQPDAPYALVLGTAQDAGLPQIGCYGPNCERARSHPDERRLVTSILVVDPRSGKRWLFDATPDLREQVDAMRGHPPTRVTGGARPPLMDGIFLTHGHMGHYTGLLHLGREAYGAAGVAVYASKQMGSFLRKNGPWSLMVREGNIALLSLEEGLPIPLGGDLSVTPISVPHRNEYTDTLAFLVEGPGGSLLYLPDIDKWDRWDRRIEDLIERVDVALLDGAFFADGEIPGRSMADIPHPFISESLERFRALPPELRARIVFTHLNHTNPATAEKSPEARTIREAGMSVAREGDIFRL